MVETEARQKTLAGNSEKYVWYRRNKVDAFDSLIAAAEHRRFADRRFADKLFDPEKWINAAKNNRPQLWIEFL